MSCSRVKNTLSEYIDGALAPADRYAVEAHLAACTSCRAECEAQRRMARLLIEMPRRQLGPDFDTALQAWLQALDPAPRRAGLLDRLRSGGSRAWRPLLAPLAIAGLAVALWRPLMPPPTRARPPVPAPAREPSPMANGKCLAQLVTMHELRDLPEREAMDDALRATSVGDLIE
jgi:anti-sigma factor RsiW